MQESTKFYYRSLYIKWLIPYSLVSQRKVFFRCFTDTQSNAWVRRVFAATAAAKLLQSCPTLWNPTDGSPAGSPVPGIPQARTLEWVAISFSNAWKWKVKVKSLSHVWLLATPGTAAYQAPPSMGFSRQEYWSGLPLPSPVKNTSGLWSKSDLGWNPSFAIYCLSFGFQFFAW